MTTPVADRARVGRWLLAGVALVVLVVSFVLLGRWQWERTQDILAAERAALAAPVDVREVVGPGDLPNEAIGRAVTVTGTYDPALTAIVTGRALDGEPGDWIVSGLPQPDGSVVAVVRGWVPDGTGAAVPAGEVTVTGVLHPDERFFADAAPAPGTVAAIASERLADVWGVPVAPGFVMLAAQEPARSGDPAPVPPTVQTADVPFPWQNFAYAFQWWIFALFAVAVFVRWIWLDARARRAGYGGGS
jgi:cytochrome oxidase assembly protein ShyY1